MIVDGAFVKSRAERNEIYYNWIESSFSISRQSKYTFSYPNRVAAAVTASRFRPHKATMRGIAAKAYRIGFNVVGCGAMSGIEFYGTDSGIASHNEVSFVYSNKDGGGNIYRWKDKEMEGWLCPARSSLESRSIRVERQFQGARSCENW